MSKLDDLINKFCPDGVEFKRLGECIYSLNTGLNPRQFFQLNTDDAKNYYVTIREIINGKIVFSKSTDRINDEAMLLCNNRSNLEKGDVLFSGTGTIGRTCVLKETPKNWNIKEGVYTIKPNQNVILSKYLSYCLQSTEVRIAYMSKSAGGTVQSVPMKEMKNLEIPVPPLEIQNEIVRILDNFTELEEELEEELVARRKQYEYYRDSLLTFDDETILKPLGDFATITRGGSFQKKDFVESGLPCIHYGQMYTHFRTYTDKTLTFLNEDVFNKSRIAQPNDIVMAVTSENVEDVCSCVAWIGTEPIAVSGHTAIIHHNQNAKYLAYYFQTAAFFKQKQKLAHGTKVIEVTPDKLSDIKIPIPSLEKQKEIADMLDRFEALCNDITSGLPAEIEARHKQYEYYRDKLLTFKRKSA